MERRDIPFELASLQIEERADGKNHQLTGYSAVFYRQGVAGTEYELGRSYDGRRIVERLMPGAFTTAVKEDDVRALFNHDPSNILGRTPLTLRLNEDETGLRYEVDLPDTDIARRLIVAVQRKDVTGNSFAFRVTDYKWHFKEDEIIREIRKVKLYDVGPVTYPAYKGTTLSLRSDSGVDIESLRQEVANSIFHKAKRERIAQMAEKGI